MAKSCSVGDLTYYHRVRVKITDVSTHPVNGEAITVEALTDTIINGANCGPRRWVLTREQLEEGW